MGHSQIWKYFKSDQCFIGRKILKYFNDFYNCHFSLSLQN